MGFTRIVNVDIEQEGTDEYKITVDPSTIPVSRANNDSVEWHTATCDSISVTHSGAPLFTNSRPFHGTIGTPAQSGPVKANASLHSRRDYKITAVAFGITFVIDPRVRVDP